MRALDKRGWSLRAAVWVCLLAAFGSRQVAAQTDEIDAMLDVEAAAGSGRVEAPADGKAGEERARVAVGGDTAALASALDGALTELAELKKENERLKDVVRRILAAHRRERATMHYNMGCVFRAARQFRKAEDAFLQALEIRPEDPYVHYNLGVLYETDLKQPSKARPHYERFLELAPGDPDAVTVRAWLKALE